MTVAELIALLQRFDGDDVVRIWTDTDFGSFSISESEPIMPMKNRPGEVYINAV